MNIKFRIPISHKGRKPKAKSTVQPVVKGDKDRKPKPKK